MKVLTMFAAGAAFLLTGIQLSAAADGKAVYDRACGACHAKGVLGAPKLGDKEKWAALGKSGPAKLADAVAKGKGKMPAQKLPAEDIKAAVQYMLKAGG